jgi:hypothetical protein
MSKKISIFKATYGKRLDEVNRNDINVAIGQDKFENPDNIGNDLDPEEVYLKASDLAMEQAEYDAIQAGYENIDSYAMDPNIYNLKSKDGTDGDGKPYSPGEQLIDMLRVDFEDMIRSGEVDL